MKNPVPAGLEWWPVKDSKSGSTVAWAHDESEMTAYVKFGSGAIYRYFDVPISVVREIQRSDYVSGTIARILKDKSRFKYEEVV